MNRPPVFACLVLAVATAGCGFGPDDVIMEFGSTPTSVMGDGGYQYGATTDGDTWWWDVSFADVKDTPDWVPGGEPPLPVSKAIQLAEREVDKYTTMPRAYQLDTVEWLHIGNHMNDERKWIYLVTFERLPTFEGQRFAARGTLIIPVLLDGRVIMGTKKSGLVE